MADLELIVIDDGSTDDSLAVLAGFADPRMRVIAQTNHGAHAAINTGLGMARGEYLAILNSDDLFHPQRLEKLTPVLRENSRVGLAASYIEIIGADGFVRDVKRGCINMPPQPLNHPELSFGASGDIRHALTTENYLATSSNFVFPRAIWQRHQPFRPLRYAHDWDFALRVVRSHDIVLVPEPLLQYRLHSSNTIHEGSAQIIFETCWCTAVHLPVIARAEISTSSEYLSRLLHSMHHYGGGGLFVATMFAHLTCGSDEARELLALQLLDPKNAQRRAYLDYLELQRSEQQPPLLTGFAEQVRRRIRTPFSVVKRAIRLALRNTSHR
jgi:glycosyltransferase involved in cell wall biosynthesis